MSDSIFRGNVPFNTHGGLTLVAMPGFEEIAREVATMVSEKSARDGQIFTQVDVVVPTFDERPSGEPFVKMEKQHVGGHDVIVLTSGPGTYEMTGQLIYVLGYLAGRQASRIKVISAYFPQGRSDKDDEGNEFALPPILISAFRGVSEGLLKQMICVDPHSEQITMAARQGFIVPVNLTKRLLRHVVEHALSVNDRIVLGFPDGSAKKRFRKALGAVETSMGRKFPTVYATAERVDAEHKTLESMGGDLSVLKGALVIQLDDETATGGTQINAALKLKEAGAEQVWAAVTHGVLCGRASELFGAEDCAVNRLYVTDTVLLNRSEIRELIDKGRVHILSWLNDMAWVVYRLHWDLSIREMR